MEFLPTNSQFTRRIFPADPQFLASLVWMRTKYYFGSQAVNGEPYDSLLDLLDQITDLAPDWYYPYFYGAVLLYAEAEQPEEAFFLVNKGLHHYADAWQLHFLKGFILWRHFQNLEGAAACMFRASRQTGAPRYLPRLAASLARDSGNPKKALDYLYTTMEGILNSDEKRTLEAKIKELTPP